MTNLKAGSYYDGEKDEWVSATVVWEDIGSLVQFTDDGGAEYFQSYNSVIVRNDKGRITLDEHYWDYSVTTSKYRNQFLGENKLDTQRKIDDGTYTLADLNP